MNILIVGATGTLGRQIARRALDEGYQVRCLVRSFRKAAFLKEWGAELVGGDLCDPTSLPPALEGITAVIDAATARPTDSQGIRKVDWDGQVSLIQAAKTAGVDRFIFFSILDCEKYPYVPLMEIKRCTETFLAESGLNYTILRPCGFMQGLIGQYAIPVLEKQAVWVMGDGSPTAYMDTQDIARFAVQALKVPETVNRSFPVVGTRAWGAYEIIRLCERLSGREAKISKMPIGLLRTVQKTARFFQWGWNLADRLAFAEVVASGQTLDAPMDETYAVFGINRQETTTVENYLQEYFGRITKKLKELEFERERAKERKKKKRSPFKSATANRAAAASKSTPPTEQSTAQSVDQPPTE
ncbi:SDR family oxidoreductase [Phormidium tenue FACHB-886]|nr:SDR family oxidoreductase [Phormidium tenue FACHB-886]